MTSVLVTGGTGSFGQAFIRAVLAGTLTERIVVFSRDELKQHEMRQGGLRDERLRYFIGDVRDRDRLLRAMRDVDVVVHAAAMKQVPACEYNPGEAIKTNVTGTANVIDAALDMNVDRVIMVSSDKAVDPVNIYGSTKLTAEKLVVDANPYGGYSTRFSVCRYGNVINSRGSVLPLFRQQAADRTPLTVTDPGMTRFVLTLEQGVEFVHESLVGMRGGEVYVPKLPAVSILTIADAVRAPVGYEFIGPRPGEKQHETLISEHEAPRTYDCGDHYLVAPLEEDRSRLGALVPAGFVYRSDTADRLDIAGFRALAGLAP